MNLISLDFIDLELFGKQAFDTLGTAERHFACKCDVHHSRSTSTSR